MYRLVFLIVLFSMLVSLGPAPGHAEQKPEKKMRLASVFVRGELPESSTQVGLFGNVRMDLRKLVMRLDKAAKDDRLDGVVLRVRTPVIGHARLSELRDAVRRVRKAGKTVYADLQMATARDYLLACACDEIIMPESGTLMITGVRAEVAFLKRLLDKIGVRADMLQVGDYKGAAEPLMRDSMSPQFREQYNALVDDLYDQIVDTVANDRQIDRENVLQLIDKGLFTAADALEAGLIDHVEYPRGLEDRIKSAAKASELVMVDNYGRKKIKNDFSGMMGMMKMMEMLMGGKPTGRSTKTKKIAVIYASGPIMTGRSTPTLFGDKTIGSQTLVKNLREADEDEKVVAIVLRVDSPGGSALASDLIWHEIDHVKKPIVASMGDVAASGGYYISMGCDKVFAEPGTLTGSIGVVGGKLAIGGLLDKVGVTTETISRGKNSGLLSADEPFSDLQRDVLMRQMKETYHQFVRKAAAGRKIDDKRMESLAGGRIWTGRQAHANGLVDQLGTVQDAVEAARQLAGIAGDEKTELLILPKRKSFFDQMLEDSMYDVRLRTTVDALAPNTGKVLSELYILERLFAEPSVLMLPYRVEIK